MGILMGALGGAGEAMAGIGAANMKADLARENEMALNEQRSKLDTNKQMALEKFREGLRTAPLDRFSASVKQKYGEKIPVEAAPVTTASGQDPQLAANTAGMEAAPTSGMSGNYAELVAKAKSLPPEDQQPYLEQLKRQFGADQAAAQSAVAGKTRARTSDEAFNAALDDARINDIQAYAAARPLAAEKTLTVADGAAIIDPKTGKVIFQNSKDKSMPAALQEYEYAQKQGYQGSFADWTTEQKRAGAQNLSINTGQHGFTNALKLREDFKTEPIYKAHQEVQSAYAQIQQSLTKQSPAGDLAGATKIMKLLDPGSVVRESELAMAMSATGALDRLEGYASNVIKGTKLNPAQRKDFQELADRLYSESAKQYNVKQNEYRGIAERNGLSIEDVVGKPANVPKREESSGKTGEWGIRMIK